ncbi:ornithine carbamoyltransferase [Amycolatopsis sp. GA6-003]|uniref:ornithine carbamoyltransferase n=1 Tax=Amycolatopsis sp. GA6-003 TaxID=2652444 RepID=UPI0039171F80
MVGCRHLISVSKLSDEELFGLVERSVEFAVRPERYRNSLSGRVVGIYFRNLSTRTRTAFSAAALRLGAGIVSYGPGDLQENTGETVRDTGEVLSRMLDALVVRTAGPDAEYAAYAAQSRMPVINAMSKEEHPTQAIADLATVRLELGGVDGARVVYIGEGNNSAVALALALTRFKATELLVVTPPGYGLPPEVSAAAAECARASGSKFAETRDLRGVKGEADFVYTTRWQTTGTSKADPSWRQVFEPYRVDEELLARFSGAAFMHDLPAHRGEEVSEAVLEGSASIAFDQAENKLHSAAAILEWCLEGN